MKGASNWVGSPEAWQRPPAGRAAVRLVRETVRDAERAACDYHFLRNLQGY